MSTTDSLCSICQQPLASSSMLAPNSSCEHCARKVQTASRQLTAIPSYQGSRAAPTSTPLYPRTPPQPHYHTLQRTDEAENGGSNLSACCFICIASIFATAVLC